MRLSDHAVDSLLAGAIYPVSRWQVLAWAEYNGASPAVTDQIRQLEAREYSSSQQVAEELCRLAGDEFPN